MRKFIPYQQVLPTSGYLHILRNLGLTFLLKGELRIMRSPHELEVSCLRHGLAAGGKEAITMPCRGRLV